MPAITSPTIAKKEDFINKRLTWNEAVKLFPDRWVSFRDYILDGVTFQNGILANVFTDDEYEDYLFSHWDDDLRIMRTSSSLTIGIN